MKQLGRLFTGVLVAAIMLAGMTASPAVAQGKKGGAAVTIVAADLKWNDVPNMTGVKIAVAGGDPAKGASHFFVKFTPGLSVPDHHHSADHFVSVMAGTIILTIDGKEVKLPAGSFFSFTGKKVHTTKCDTGAECMLFVDARSKWDVVPEAARKTEPKRAEPKK